MLAEIYLLKLEAAVRAAKEAAATASTSRFVPVAAGVIALLAGALLNVPTLPVLLTGGVIWTWLLCCYNESLCPPSKASEAAATEAATAAPSRIANTPTRGYACEASMAGHRAATLRVPQHGLFPC
jgi:hypothetical protein